VKQAATCDELKVHRSLTDKSPTNHTEILHSRLHSKSGSDRLLQLTSLVGGANVDHKCRFQDGGM